MTQQQTLQLFIPILIILPVLGLIEKTRPVPNSIAEAVLLEGVSIGAPAPAPTVTRG